MFLIFMAVLLIKGFVMDVLIVDGISMYPTLNETKSNDRVIVNKIKQFTNSYKRGDIIIAKPNDENKFIIKRIIGLPNDLIEIKNGKVYVNNNLLDESYLKVEGKTYPSIKIKVPENHLYILGDNRLHSADSRQYGAIPFENIIGHAMCKFNIFELSGEGL